MSEKPILMNGEMVRAILDGRKTQTRRVIKPQPFIAMANGGSIEWVGVNKRAGGVGIDEFSQSMLIHTPYAVGDTLWARETWLLNGTPSLDKLRIQFKVGDERPHDKNYIGYLVRRYALKHYEDAKRMYLTHERKWRPSIHMPRWAARIFMTVNTVRVERVQDISEEDAKAEGVSPENAQLYGRGGAYQNGFWELWDSINEKRGYGWDVNPYVWVYEFEREKS